MVDSISTVSSDGAVTRIAATTPVTAATPAANPVAASNPIDIVKTGGPQAGGLARAMAASAPVDADRVATIKKAIADGRFPILPATIADRLIAFKLHWNPDEPEQHD